MITSFIKDVSVFELKSLYDSGDYDIEIDSPDGFQKLGKWFDKGVLTMVEVETTSNKIRCATNHLIQTDHGIWVEAGNLVKGTLVQARSGYDEVISVTAVEAEECYDFEVLHPNHRYYSNNLVSHNSGKSYFCAGNIVKNAQDQGIYVILIDTENALDEAWLQALGVQTTDDKLLKINMAMIDDVAKTITGFMNEYKELPVSERPKVLFVIDSLGMLLTPTDVNQFEAGELKGDMGRKPKALTALVRNCVNMFGSYNVGLVVTNHTYSSQDPYNPDDTISGGQGFIYASSIVVAMKKLKLKEDEDGNKVSEIKGIRAGCKIMKTRYSKPFEAIEVKIPYDHGMDPYSGLFDLFEKNNTIVKEGNRYSYIDISGEVHKYYRKEWNRNHQGILDLVMSEFLIPRVQHSPDEPDTNSSDNVVDDVDSYNNGVTDDNDASAPSNSKESETTGFKFYGEGVLGQHA